MPLPSEPSHKSSIHFLKAYYIYFVGICGCACHDTCVKSGGTQLSVLAFHRVDAREPSQITLALNSVLKTFFRTLLDNVSKKLQRSAESPHLLLHSVLVTVKKHLWQTAVDSSFSALSMETDLCILDSGLHRHCFQVLLLSLPSSWKLAVLSLFSLSFLVLRAFRQVICKPSPG